MKKRFMKKWSYVLVYFTCFMLCSLSARADLIFEPSEDTFYDLHSSECEYIDRVYTANGPDGKVILYESPESDVEITTWENGHIAYISFIYTDQNGTVWGIYNNGDVTESGWMPMEYMKVVYDSISFQEEYDAEITEELGSIEEDYQGETIYFWKYPGSQDMDFMTADEYVPQYDKVYVDEEGRRWGHINYYYGRKNVWICIDQPTADFETLYPDGAPQRGSAQEEPVEYGTERITPKTEHNNSTVILAAVIVIAVVVITALLLLFLKRSGRKKE